MEPTIRVVDLWIDGKSLVETELKKWMVRNIQLFTHAPNQDFFAASVYITYSLRESKKNGLRLGRRIPPLGAEYYMLTSTELLRSRDNFFKRRGTIWGTFFRTWTVSWYLQAQKPKTREYVWPQFCPKYFKNYVNLGMLKKVVRRNMSQQIEKQENDFREDGWSGTDEIVCSWRPHSSNHQHGRRFQRNNTKAS